MLKKLYRLKANTRLAKNTVYTSPYFTLRIALNDLPHSRYGFVVTKKIDKRAVSRNRVKRQMRVCIEKKLAEIKGGYDILVFIKKDALNQETKELCSSIEQVLMKAGLI